MSMRAEGTGFTVITARGSVPLPMVARATGRTIEGDAARKAKKMTGFDWPQPDPDAPPPRVVAPAPTRRAPRTRRAPSQPSGRSLPPSPTVAQVDAMEAAYKAGKPLNAVAAEAGYSRSTVAKYLHERGVDMNPPGNNIRFRQPVVLADKVCEACGKTYSFTPGERVQSFRQRHSCSPRCGAILSGRRRTGKSQGSRKS